MRKIVTTVFILALIGCSSTATSYQEAHAFGDGGYKAKEKDPGVWRVWFSGNTHTTRDTVQAYWLYQCAELTLQQGYDGFQILTYVDLASSDLVQLASSAPVFIPMYNTSDAGDRLLEGDIKLLKKPLTPIRLSVFDAATLRAALAPYVMGQKCSDGNVCPHLHSYLFSN